MHHDEHHFRGSEQIRDIVIGMADGLTVPFALAAGLSGAVDSNGIILAAGLAEVAAGSIAMGLGGYLAGRTDADHYQSELKREYYEVEAFPEKEKEEVAEVLEAYNVAPALRKLVAEDLAQRKEDWVKFMMRYELGLEEPDPNRALQSALLIAVSYIVGGLLPLAPYFFIKNTSDALWISSAVTLTSLLIFGYWKSRLTGQPAMQGALKVALIGALAAGAAFVIAKAVS